MANFRKVLDSMKIELWNYDLCNLTVQSAETGCWTARLVHNSHCIQAGKDSNVSVATRKLQSVDSCRDRMDSEWAEGNSIKEFRIWPMYSVTPKLHNALILPMLGGWMHT